MGGFSIWHWLVVAAIVMLLFGRGRIADIMGEVGRGITGFRRGLSDDEAPRTPAER